MALDDSLVGERIEYKNLSRIVEERIKSIIRSGQLRPGDQIPSHDELCKRWGVSLTTVRDALGRLESMGIVEKVHGKGTFVREVALDKLMTYQEINGILVKEDKFHAQLLEVRACIEPTIAELAAIRRNAEQLNELEQLIDELGDAHLRLDHVAYVEADRRFHMALSDMAGNLFFHKIMKELQPSISQQQLEIMSLSDSEQRSLFAKSHGDHQDVFEAIRDRKPAQAAEAMRRHMQCVREFFEIGDYP